MKTGVEGKYQRGDISNVFDFIRENGLASEIESTPVVTRKGERFFQQVRGPDALSNSGLAGVI